MSTFPLIIGGYGAFTFGRMGYDIYRIIRNRRMLLTRAKADPGTSLIYQFTDPVCVPGADRRINRYGIPLWGKGSNLTRRERKAMKARYFESVRR